jgi:Electron transfer DM13
MKKSTLFLSLLLVLSFAACRKVPVDNTPIVTTPTDKILFIGSFQNGAHTVTGTAKIIEDASKKRYLVLENLKSDVGPDIRVYLATDKTAKDFVEVNSTVTNGNTKTELPAAANTDKQKYVLIWCKQYSVLFGNALLQ